MKKISTRIALAGALLALAAPGASALDHLLIIGDATPGGWSMDNATALSLKDGCFVWEGTLGKGELKACIEPDGSFQCPFVRPTFNGCKISKSGVESAEFVYTTDPDDKWLVTDAGKYRLSFDIEAWTLTATFIE